VSRGGAEAVAAALEGCDGKVVAVGRNLEPLRAVLEAGGAGVADAAFFRLHRSLVLRFGLTRSLAGRGWRGGARLPAEFRFGGS